MPPEAEGSRLVPRPSRRVHGGTPMAGRRPLVALLLLAAGLHATLSYALLRLPAAIGHDTLSDSLALLGAVTALRLGEVALRLGGHAAAVACGLAAGLGYLARPEVVIVPAAVALALAARRLGP